MDGEGENLAHHGPEGIDGLKSRGRPGIEKCGGYRSFLDVRNHHTLFAIISAVRDSSSEYWLTVSRGGKMGANRKRRAHEQSDDSGCYPTLLDEQLADHR